MKCSPAPTRDVQEALSGCLPGEVLPLLGRHGVRLVRQRVLNVLGELVGAPEQGGVEGEKGDCSACWPGGDSAPWVSTIQTPDPPTHPTTITPPHVPHLKMRQFLNCEKKRLEGWSAQMTHLPMASASAVVVATTSEVEGLMNTWRGRRGRRGRGEAEAGVGAA